MKLLLIITVSFIIFSCILPACNGRINAEGTVSGSTDGGTHTSVETSGNGVGSATAEISGACFPSDAKVILKSGASKKMSELEIGDSVLVSKKVFSKVFSFTHRDYNITYKFVRIFVEDSTYIDMSPGHYIYVNKEREVKEAQNVKIGEYLVKTSGENLRVSSITNVWKSGLFNPHTMQGDISVNSFITTTYTDAVSDFAAHSMLLPLRFAFSYFNISTSIFEDSAVLSWILKYRTAYLHK